MGSAAICGNGIKTYEVYHFMKIPYLTAPVPSSEIPSGIPYIIGNELAERFSYYGMRAILIVFMTQYLMDADGRLAPMDPTEAKAYFHLFVSVTYITPLLGAVLADGLWGKYKTILLLSSVYCLGLFCLVLDDTRTGLLVGQALIALGAGGIKPCVSAHLGDQFGAGNRHLLGKVFSWFYLTINLGAFISMLLAPWLLKTQGAPIAFLVPGLLMLLATLLFWSGRYQFVHISPAGMNFVRDALSTEGLRVLGRLSGIYLFIAMFWALFDQNSSSWVLQAQHMDRLVFGIEILPSQIQAANPLLIVLLIPLFHQYIYPALGKHISLGYLNKIAIGLFLTVLSFVLVAFIQLRIDAGFPPHIAWQLLAYLLLTSAEVMVSITCLEFSYTQAPKTMKSLVMSLYMLAVALGNLFTSGVNFVIGNPDGSSDLAGAGYFWFFAALMMATAVGFVWYSQHYQEQTHLQE
jgi:POT family proton-dependent oligopeptide transporter